MTQPRNWHYVEDLAEAELAASDSGTRLRADVPPTAPDARWELGNIVAKRFVLDKPLRRGRHGTVYTAIDLVLSRTRQRDARYVALHELHSRVTALPSQVREFAEFAAQPLSWSHPNLPRVLDCGRDGAKYYLTSELFEGASLRQVLDEPAPEGLSMDEVFAILRSVGDGLEYAHAKGFVHGELRAEDVLVTTDYGVKVLDFFPLHTPRSVDYFPEDAVGPGTLDVRDDVFGVACLAYELLAGRHPFNGNSPLEALRAGLTPLPLLGLEPSAWGALSRGLALLRERRTTTVAELLTRLGVQGTAKLRPPPPQAEQPPRTESPPAIIAPHPVRQPTQLRTAPRPRARPKTQTPPRRSVRRPLLALTLAAVLAGAVYKDYPSLRSSASDAIERGVVVARESGPIILGAIETATAKRAASPRANTPATSAAIATGVATADLPREVEAIAPVVENVPPVSAPSPSIEPPAVAPVAAPLVPTGPEFAVATATITVSENAPNARVVVRRSGSLATDASVVWWTSDGTATADSDYADLGARIEKFAAGEESLALLVPLVADSHPEQVERFFVNLTPSGVRAARAVPEIRVEVIVLDDDT